jgi:hypothetical protein
MTDNEKLLVLKIQLFTAMQTLKDADLAEFWQMIDDVNACREAKGLVIVKNPSREP